MHADLEKLIALQQAEVELRRVEEKLKNVPRAREQMEARLAEDRGRLDAAKGALADSQKARKQHEAALQDLETKRSKYKGQLMEVKTNKEYTAMLHEIEGVERDIREREDQVLAEMERAEALSAEVKREEALFKSVEENARAEALALESDGRKLEEEHRRLQAARDATAATVPEDAMQLFQRVARLRGVAVAEARDDMCQLCHVKLRPQLYLELKRNESIVQCAHCSRILYYVPTAPAVAPGP
jgi:predicted  nucleic acid-binding Zn-ribbon protein